MLTDSFGRKLDYLRVSITDRCNQRCIYCMPPDGVNWKPHDSLLSFEESLRLCRILAELGIRKVKVTGGEPLVRRGAASFLTELKKLPGIEKLTLTTNGILLGAYLDEVSVLPDGVNISLDALDRERYTQITKTENIIPEEILSNIDRLLEKKVPVKINCVPIRGFNEEELVPLAGLAKKRNISVRFIELMPLGIASNLNPINGSQTAALLEKSYGALTFFPGVQGNGPAVYYSLPGFAGKIGFINPISHGFCESCNRLRLTSEGLLKPCLSGSLSLDLRALLRRKETACDKAITQAIIDIIARKPRCHTLSQTYSNISAENADSHSEGMFEIGG